jgi:aspartate/methionine/tyrosine aminotransferase
MSFLEAGDVALLPNPGYPTYRAATVLAGATPLYYDLDARNHWLPDLKTLATQDLSRVKIMWVNYPHMPTGARATAAFSVLLVQIMFELPYARNAQYWTKPNNAFNHF